ncbi:hypothetical protein [Desulfosporosinus sp. FKB]|uniref:hypothetical protein n=1 Tax=Desulfosporosinus sp. FKB TaxID=1969835 RepID=UPI00112519C4|nr:hypothetical protein [Desulfosporosinus sp. FKB]
MTVAGVYRDLGLRAEEVLGVQGPLKSEICQNSQLEVVAKSLYTFGQKDHLPQYGHFNNLEPPMICSPRIYWRKLILKVSPHLLQRYCKQETS